MPPKKGAAAVPVVKKTKEELFLDAYKAWIVHDIPIPDNLKQILKDPDFRKTLVIHAHYVKNNNDLHVNDFCDLAQYIEENKEMIIEEIGKESEPRIPLSDEQKRIHEHIDTITKKKNDAEKAQTSDEIKFAHDAISTEYALFKLHVIEYEPVFELSKLSPSFTKKLEEMREYIKDKNLEIETPTEGEKKIDLGRSWNGLNIFTVDAPLHENPTPNKPNFLVEIENAIKGIQKHSITENQDGDGDDAGSSEVILGEGEEVNTFLTHLPAGESQKIREQAKIATLFKDDDYQLPIPDGEEIEKNAVMNNPYLFRPSLQTPSKDSNGNEVRNINTNSSKKSNTSSSSSKVKVSKKKLKMTEEDLYDLATMLNDCTLLERKRIIGKAFSKHVETIIKSTNAIDIDEDDDDEGGGEVARGGAIMRDTTDMMEM